MTVSVTITNSGKTAGKEVVELYLSAEKSIDKPKEELKAFGKTNLLQPGESQTITLEINAKDLICSNKKRLDCWAGNYKVAIGSSSLNIKKTALFSLANIKIVEKTNPTFTQI
jgi:beta-glucosidase